MRTGRALPGYIIRSSNSLSPILSLICHPRAERQHRARRRNKEDPGTTCIVEQGREEERRVEKELGNSGASLGKRRGARRNAVPSGDIPSTRARPCVAVSSILYDGGKPSSPPRPPFFSFLRSSSIPASNHAKITRNLAIIGRNEKKRGERNEICPSR